MRADTRRVRYGALLTELEGFEQDGLLELEYTGYAENIRGTLTPAGVEYVERIRQLGGDLAGRREAARDALLY